MPLFVELLGAFERSRRCELRHVTCRDLLLLIFDLMTCTLLDVVRNEHGRKAAGTSSAAKVFPRSGITL